MHFTHFFISGPEAESNLVRRFQISLEVRELCEGGELFDTVAEQGGLEVEATVAWFSQALDAVTYCHATSAVNGRLRPEQVLLDRQDRVKLLSGDERGHIVRQLKAKWDSVNEQYVPIPKRSRNMCT